MRILSLLKAKRRCCVVLLAGIAVPALAADTVIHAGRLIDGKGGEPQSSMSIVIHNDRISEVVSGFINRPGADVIDLSQATVLPGLINCHLHVTDNFRPGNPIANDVLDTDFDRIFLTVPSVRETLESGFTSIRDTHASNPLMVVALKHAIERGVIVGPRMWVVGSAISVTGGHGDARNGFDPELNRSYWKDNIADTPDEAVKVVRRMRQLGADWIKIDASGGASSMNDDPIRQQMSDAEIKAITDTAHMLGIRVAAHAHGKASIDSAIRNGVDSIEHGTFADADSYRLFVEHGTYLVPTLLIIHVLQEQIKEHPQNMLPTTTEKILLIATRLSLNLTNAYHAGVKIAFGTDYTENAAREFALMVAAGMKPMDTIVAATSRAADLLGDSADIGSIETGKYADIVAVPGNPLADITEMEKVFFVMKGGAIVRSADKAHR